MRTRNIIISLAIVILLILAGWAFWHFMAGPVQVPISPQGNGEQPGFTPLNRPGTGGKSGGKSGQGASTTTPSGGGASLPMLRLLSGTPIGGYGASTTASTTYAVWVDRGRGNVYEASYDSAAVATLSNTVVPKIFDAVWDKNLTSFIGSLFQDGDLTPTTVYAQLSRQGQGSTTPSGVAPYALKGKDIPGKMIGYAASPDKSKIFLLMDEGGRGVGYVASFNGAGMKQIFSSPATELSVSWPADNTIAIATKSSSFYSGFLYFVNPKTGIWKKILGPLSGLSAAVSHDARYVLYSYDDKDGAIQTGIYSVAAATSTDAVFHTLADKCAWGNAHAGYAFCGVPSQPVAAIMPDQWNLGQASFVDKIWSIRADTGEVRLVASLLDQADRSIDAYRLGFDPKDHYLFFMNKNDLSFWSLDLTNVLK